MISSPLTVRSWRLSVVVVVGIRLHISCPKMSDRLLSEAEQLVLERGLVVAEPEPLIFSFFVFLGASGIQGTLCSEFSCYVNIALFLFNTYSVVRTLVSKIKFIF